MKKINKSRIMDYILLITLGVLFGTSILMGFNVVNDIDKDQSTIYLIASVFLTACLAFINIGREQRRVNPARYDKEFYKNQNHYTK